MDDKTKGAIFMILSVVVMFSFILTGVSIEKHYKLENAKIELKLKQLEKEQCQKLPSK